VQRDRLPGDVGVLRLHRCRIAAVVPDCRQALPGRDRAAPRPCLRAGNALAPKSPAAVISRPDMKDQLTLYGSPHSQFTYKIALMLRLAGQPFAFRYVSFQQGMHRTKEFRALSPWAEVPVLVHRGRTMVQSAAILEYLAATLHRFAGETDEQDQSIREWLYWDAHRLAPPIHAMYGVHLADR